MDSEKRSAWSSASGLEPRRTPSTEPSAASIQNPFFSLYWNPIHQRWAPRPPLSLGAPLLMPLPPQPHSLYPVFPGRARPHLQRHPDLIGHLSDQGLGNCIGCIALLAVHLDHRALGTGRPASDGPTGKETRPRTSQAVKSLRRNRSISPCGIRAGGSPHACPCKRPSKGWDGGQEAGPSAPTSIYPLETSLTHHTILPLPARRS